MEFAVLVIVESVTLDPSLGYKLGHILVCPVQYRKNHIYMVFTTPVHSADDRVGGTISFGSCRALAPPNPLYRHIHNLVFLQLLTTESRPPCREPFFSHQIKELNCRFHYLHSILHAVSNRARGVYSCVLIDCSIFHSRHLCQFKDNIAILSPAITHFYLILPYGANYQADSTIDFIL